MTLSAMPISQKTITDFESIIINSLPHEKSKEIQLNINNVSQALAIETKFRQKHFEHVFGNLPSTIDLRILSEIKRLYNDFYTSGNVEELNSYLHERNFSVISSDPTISMGNYRKLAPLVEKFMNSRLELYDSVPSMYKEALSKLETQCLLFQSNKLFADIA